MSETIIATSCQLTEKYLTLFKEAYPGIIFLLCHLPFLAGILIFLTFHLGLTSMRVTKTCFFPTNAKYGNRGGDEMRSGYVRYVQGNQPNVPACTMCRHGLYNIISGTYCHKTGTRPPNCVTTRQPTIYLEPPGLACF